jgi:hypothetical protein
MRVVMIRVAVLALISLAAMVFCLVLFSKWQIMFLWE